MHLVCNPLINLHLQDRFDAYPKRRGLTRVKEMVAAGVNVAFGSDDIMDPWFPLGTGNPVQVALVVPWPRSSRLLPRSPNATG